MDTRSFEKSVLPRGGQRKLVSLLVPARNEEGNLPRAFDEISAVFAGLPYDYEVLLIDNASSDDTPRLARELCRRDPRLRYLRLSRDFSVEGSLAAGLQMAQGDAAMIVFSDLQDPPQRIPEFLARWEDGYDVVYGLLSDRGPDPFWKSSCANLVYRFLGTFAPIPIPPAATDFRLLSRRAIDVLNQCPEQQRYLRGLSHWIGFPSCPVQYQRRPRTAEKSKASLAVMFHLAGNALTGFSLAPLRLCSIAGLLLASAAMLLGLANGLLCMAGVGGGISGIGLLLLAQLAVTLLCTGLLGEYVGRTYWESKRRPLYAIEETCNVASHNRTNSDRETALLLHTYPAHVNGRNRSCTQQHCHAA